MKQNKKKKSFSAEYLKMDCFIIFYIGVFFSRSSQLLGLEGKGGKFGVSIELRTNNRMKERWIIEKVTDPKSSQN